ncbi:MAG: sugar transferase [Elusimicrobia bacterium]|nr:sugar transferase [Elusimicrobiota bacterium]
MLPSRKYWVVLAGDAAAIFFSFFWVTLLRRWSEAVAVPDFLLNHFLLFSALTVCWLWLFHLCGLYEMRQLRRHDEGILAVGIVTAVLLTSLALFFISGIFNIPAPKTILVLGALMSGALIHYWRLYLRKRWNNEAGSEEPAADQPVVFDRRLLAAPGVDGYHESLKNAVLAGRNVFSSFSYQAIESGKIPVDEMTAEWLVERVCSPTSARTFYGVIKRASDIFLTFFLLSQVALTAVVVACWVRFVLGPGIFYRQERVGLGGRRFTIWKFRTMKRVDELPPGKALTLEDDPRVPKSLRWVRRMHMDELPQLINVLKGEMSLVGPRPEQSPITEELEKAIPYYWVRHSTPPGLTGWAQINMGYAGNLDDAKERFAYDLYYLANRNFWLDLSILVRTLKNVIFASGR